VTASSTAETGRFVQIETARRRATARPRLRKHFAPTRLKDAGVEPWPSSTAGRAAGEGGRTAPTRRRTELARDRIGPRLRRCIPTEVSVARRARSCVETGRAGSFAVGAETTNSPRRDGLPERRSRPGPLDRSGQRSACERLVVRRRDFRKSRTRRHRIHGAIRTARRRRGMAR